MMSNFSFCRNVYNSIRLVNFCSQKVSIFCVDIFKFVSAADMLYIVQGYIKHQLIVYNNMSVSLNRIFTIDPLYKDISSLCFTFSFILTYSITVFASKFQHSSLQIQKADFALRVLDIYIVSVVSYFIYVTRNTSNIIYNLLI